MTAAPDFDGLHKTHHHEQDSERPQMSSPHSESSPSKSSMSSGSTNEEVAQASQSFLASIQSNHPPPNLSDYSPDKFQEVMNNYMQTIMSAAANRFQQDPNSAALFLTQQNSMLQASSLNSLSSPSKISTSTPTSIESGSVSSSPMPLIMCNANDADKMLNQVEEISQANVELSTDSSSSTLMDIQKDLNARVDQDVEEYSSFECNVKEMTLTEVPVVAEKMSKVETQTNDLIKKQMNEIEKEITRRSQNKNVRKIDGQELAQLLSSLTSNEDYNNCSFGTTTQNTPQTAPTSTTFPYSNNNKSAFKPIANPQAALPFNATSKISSNENMPQKPTLRSLESSFSPPSNPPSHSPTDQTTFQSTPYYSNSMSSYQQQTHHPNNHYNQNSNQNNNQNNNQTSSPSTMPFSPSMPQFNTPPQLGNNMSSSSSINSFARFNPFLQSPGTPSQSSTMLNSAEAQPNSLSNEFFNPLHCSQSSLPSADPPQLSNITPELAAAILSQLQSNPSLLENIAASSGTTNLGQTSATTQQPKVMGGPPTNLMKIPPPPTISVPQPRANFCNSGSSSSSTNKTTSRFRNENGWESETKNNNHHQTISEDKENGDGPGEDGIWVMRDSYQKKCQADIEEESTQQDDEDIETDKLLSKDSPLHLPNITANGGSHLQPRKPSNHNKKEVLIHEPAVLIEGVLFRAKYLGSTQLICDGRPSKSSRMSQAQEAVARVKAPEGEIQPSTEIDLFISTEKIMVLNTDLQRISDTDVRQDILMDHALRTISYIADIGDLVVLMARRMSNSPSLEDPGSGCAIKKAPRVVCHVFESDEAAFIAQSIGQAFKVAYVEFLRANGIEDPDYLRESDYQEVLNSQELLGEELEMFARKETQKDVIVPKKVGECLGIVVVESGWGSMLPTVVVANLAPGGAAARSNNLNIGDQIIAINGISLVGLPLVSAQSNIKKAKTSTAVRLTVVSTPPVVEVRIKRPDKKFQLGFSVQNGVICSLLRGGIAERGGIRVGHRIIEINHKSVVAVAHEIIVNLLATATGEIHMKTMPTSMFRLLTGQEAPNYI